MRAIAVLAVLAYHADLTWARGGFLGVETFFVISGYLITALLRREWRATGRLDLRRFWMRRARRLLPALFVVLAATVAFVLVVVPEEARDLDGAVLSALGYVSNWYLVVTEQSYFEVMSRPSPLRHLWSLGIEEQFYLLWPLLLAGGLTLLGRRRLLVAIVLGTGASTALLWWLAEPGDPSRAYYGTDSRAAALLAGAALAFVWSPGRLRPTTGRGAPLVLDAIGIAALGVLLARFVAVDEFDRNLFHGGLLITALAAALAVAVVVHPSSRLRRLLGWAPLVWIGVRSYGIYLWHWPIFVFTRPHLDLPFGGWPALGLRLALTFAAAAASYRFVEQPIRNGALGRTLAELREGTSPRRRSVLRTRWTVASAGVVLVVAVLASGVVLNNEDPDLAFVAGAGSGPASRGSGEQDAAGPADSPAGADVATSASSPALVRHAGVDLDPAWGTGLTVVADSVLLSGQRVIPERLTGWTIEFLGEPALSLPDAIDVLRDHGPVAPVVVVGLGHNTLWERDRVDFDRWADRFDADAGALVATLRSLGAKKVVWVTLREADPDSVPDGWQDQYERYNWFFPYVNERLDALVERDPAIALADWAAISNRLGVTYDAMHLTTEGANLMSEVIMAGIGIQRSTDPLIP